MYIKKLNREDWASWKKIRLEALQEAPEAFGSSYEEESKFSDEAFQDWLIKDTVFGAILDNKLIGCVGFSCLNSIKIKYCGKLWGMYLKPTHREQGIASQLLAHIINHAKTQVQQLHLSCATINSVAIQLYENHGFKVYGTEPRALKINDIFYDEYLMVLVFD